MFIWQCFYSSFILEVCFTGYRIPNWLVYYFITLNMLFHRLLASDEKSSVNFIENHLVYNLGIICRFQDSLSFTFNSLILMCLNVNFFEFNILAVHWTSWMCRLLFIKFKKFSSIISSNTFFSSFVFFLGFPEASEALFIFLYSFFFLSLRLNNLNQCIFKFTDFSSFCLHKAVVEPF